jgi:sortase A
LASYLSKMVGRVAVVLVASALAAAVVGCSDVGETISGTPTGPTPKPKVVVTTKPAVPPVKIPVPTPARTTTTTAATLGIPAIGVAGLRVVPYNGTADDRAGTIIQDRGVAASPRGPRGGVGPGQLGNFIITGHRTAHGRPFGRLPELRNGEHILITSGGFVYDYVVTETMTISFRKPADLTRQNAPVPGRPGEVPTRAMITLSTCATPEDHAKGNYWHDALGNPEHRIDKVGVLTGTRPV